MLDSISQLLGYDIEELQKSFTLTEISQLFYNFNIKHDDKIYLRKDCRIFDSKNYFTLVHPTFEYPINDCLFVKNNDDCIDVFDTKLLVDTIGIPVEDEFLFLRTNQYLYKLRSSIVYYLVQNKIYNKIFVYLRDSKFYCIPKVQIFNEFCAIQPLNIKECEDLQKFIKSRIVEIDNKFKNRL